MNILLVIDMQRDFIHGVLGSPQAESIVDNVMEKIHQFTGEIFYTQDTHDSNYLNTQEGTKLPVEHCVEGTPGWEFIKGIQDIKDKQVFRKDTFGSMEMTDFMSKINKVTPIESITLIGVCTDICVISNAILLKAKLPEVAIIVDGNCCAGVTKESHDNALRAMEMCQINIMN